jgi:hypothetical protein
VLRRSSLPNKPSGPTVPVLATNSYRLLIADCQLQTEIENRQLTIGNPLAAGTPDLEW